MCHACQIFVDYHRQFMSTARVREFTIHCLHTGQVIRITWPGPPVRGDAATMECNNEPRSV